MERLIFHVDVNSAYLSWEAARRVAEGGEDLRLIPAAIGGDPENRTGVILAKSIPAKKYNIRTGEPVALALRKCPGLVLARPDFRLYEKNSKAFMDICRRYAPVVEKFSIDECFLDMTGTEKIYPQPLAVAHTIRQTIREELGFTVNIGVSTNKLLAKMASDFEKPDKVHTLFPEEIRLKLWPLPVGALFSVGQATAEKLQRARICTIGDLAATELSRLQTLVGRKLGGQLHAYANGQDNSPVSAEPEEAKGFSVSITLAENVLDMETASKILLELADSVTARMRASHARAYCVSVSIRSSDFHNRSHQKKLEEPTDITKEVYEISKALLADLWKSRTPLRLLGISLTQIVHEDAVQMSFFQDAQKEKARKLDRTLDAIRSRYGADTVKRGSTCQTDLQVGRRYRAQMENKEE
ncbi:MAG TPA: DNA polymerase IV [Firmicutes bacterium]|nr:DNA polymerase IV [Bacillota bacterium]